MGKLASLLAAVLLTATLPAAAGELKVGYVDTQRIIREAPAAVVAARNLEQDFGRREQDLRRLAADLQSRQAALDKDGITLAETERRAREREIAELSRDLQRRQRQLHEDLNQRQHEANLRLLEQADLAIGRIADGGQFDLILREAVWAAPGIDITEQVLESLSAAE
jgi:outer membrane protein